jgi:hypothetical protein
LWERHGPLLSNLLIHCSDVRMEHFSHSYAIAVSTSRRALGVKPHGVPFYVWKAKSSEKKDLHAHVSVLPIDSRSERRCASRILRDLFGLWRQYRCRWNRMIRKNNKTKTKASISEAFS